MSVSMKEKSFDLLLDFLKWSFLIVLFFAAYYTTTSKYEFKNVDVRKNKITGRIEIVNDHFEWVDLLEENREFASQEKRKAKRKLQSSTKESSEIEFFDYDPNESELDYEPRR